jgi:hypothetical protein
MSNVIQTPSTSTAKSNHGDGTHTVIQPFEKATTYGVQVTPGKPDSTPSPMDGGYNPDPEDELLDHEIADEESYEHDHEIDKEKSNKKQNKNNEIDNKDTTSIASKATTTSKSPKPYSTWLEFTDYNLGTPPRLVSQFWMEDPKIVMNYMKHWVFTGVNVKIPYFWNPIDYYCKASEPARTNKNNKTYVELNMFNVIDLCQEALTHPKFANKTVAEKLETDRLVRYTPVIADAKKHLENAEFLVRKTANQISIIERKITKLDQENNKEKLAIAKLMMNSKKKELLKLRQARDISMKEKDYAIETVESMLILFKTEAKTKPTRTAEDEEEWNLMFEEFEEKKKESITSNDDNTDTQLPKLVNFDIHSNINNTQSQISGVTEHSHDKSTTTTKPVVIIEDIPFSECKLLLNKYKDMKQNYVHISDASRGSDAAVKLNPETMSSLNHDTKEIIKITSNDLQRSECRRWKSATTLEIFTSKDMFSKCIRNRPTLMTIDSLKETPEVVLLSKKMELLTKKFQQEAQRTINSYTALEVDQYEKERFTNLEIGLKKIIRSHATKILTIEKEMRKNKHTLQRTKNPAFNVSLDDVCGFTYILLLLGPACTSLTDWAELTSPDCMMDALTKKLSTPARLTELDLEAQKDKDKDKENKMKVIKLGTMSFMTPNDDTWTLAVRTSKDMHELVAEFSLGAKTKFYNKIVDSKGNKAVRELQYTKETIDITDKVTKMLKNAKSIDRKLGLNVIKKMIASNTFAILKKRDSSIKCTSPALLNNKSKDDQIPNASVTTTISNKEDTNDNTIDNTNQSDETTAKRMREIRKEEELQRTNIIQRTNKIQQQQNSTERSINNNNNNNNNYNQHNNNHDRGRGRGNSRGGGRGWSGKTGRGRGIVNTYRRNFNRQDEHDTMNKRQKY